MGMSLPISRVGACGLRIQPGYRVKTPKNAACTRKSFFAGFQSNERRKRSHYFFLEVVELSEEFCFNVTTSLGVDANRHRQTGEPGDLDRRSRLNISIAHAWRLIQYCSWPRLAHAQNLPCLIFAGSSVHKSLCR